MGGITMWKDTGYWSKNYIYKFILYLSFIINKYYINYFNISTITLKGDSNNKIKSPKSQ